MKRRLPPCPWCGARQRLDYDPATEIFEVVCWNGHTPRYISDKGRETMRVPPIEGRPNPENFPTPTTYVARGPRGWRLIPATEEE